MPIVDDSTPSKLPRAPIQLFNDSTALSKRRKLSGGEKPQESAQAQPETKSVAPYFCRHAPNHQHNAKKGPTTIHPQHASAHHPPVSAPIAFHTDLSLSTDPYAQLQPGLPPPPLYDPSVMHTSHTAPYYSVEHAQVDLGLDMGSAPYPQISHMHPAPVPGYVPPLVDTASWVPAAAYPSHTTAVTHAPYYCVEAPVQPAPVPPAAVLPPSTAVPPADPLAAPHQYMAAPQYEPQPPPPGVLEYTGDPQYARTPAYEEMQMHINRQAAAQHNNPHVAVHGADPGFMHVPDMMHGAGTGASTATPAPAAVGATGTQNVGGSGTGGGSTAGRRAPYFSAAPVQSAEGWGNVPVSSQAQNKPVVVGAGVQSGVESLKPRAPYSVRISN